jgi:hypothetical protein
MEGHCYEHARERQKEARHGQQHPAVTTRDARRVNHTPAHHHYSGDRDETHNKDGVYDPHKDTSHAVG